MNLVNKKKANNKEQIFFVDGDPSTRLGKSVISILPRPAGKLTISANGAGKESGPECGIGKRIDDSDEDNSPAEKKAKSGAEWEHPTNVVGRNGPIWPTEHKNNDDGYFSDKENNNN